MTQYTIMSKDIGATLTFPSQYLMLDFKISLEDVLKTLPANQTYDDTLYTNKCIAWFISEQSSSQKAVYDLSDECSLCIHMLEKPIYLHEQREKHWGRSTPIIEKNLQYNQSENSHTDAHNIGRSWFVSWRDVQSSWVYIRRSLAGVKIDLCYLSYMMFRANTVNG